MISESDPAYYATVTFAGRAVELWRAKWEEKHHHQF
jgi:hypothetical protein